MQSRYWLADWWNRTGMCIVTAAIIQKMFWYAAAAQFPAATGLSLKSHPVKKLPMYIRQTVGRPIWYLAVLFRRVPDIITQNPATLAAML